MSALVFAGGSQFVAMDIWTHPASWVGVGFAALLVNIRHVLMSASSARRCNPSGACAKYAAMLFLADEIWAIAEFRAGVARLTPSWFAGIAMPFYVAWVGATLIGASLGAFLGDPAAHRARLRLSGGFRRAGDGDSGRGAKRDRCWPRALWRPFWFTSSCQASGTSPPVRSLDLPRRCGRAREGGHGMTLEIHTLLAILAMAAATVLTRMSGLLLIRHVEMTKQT